MATVSPDQSWSYYLKLPHDPRAPRVARHALRAMLELHEMDELADRAQLLTSEMVTNAYVHAEGPASMTVRSLGGERLRICVGDKNPEVPAPFDRSPGRSGMSPPGEEDETGRGLLIVRLMADNWGGYVLGDPLGSQRFGPRGKLLWFELARDAGGYTMAA